MSREIMQQALDALKPMKDSRDDTAIQRAIAALEAELAKPEQEPVAYRHLHEDGYEYYDAPTGIDCNECESLYTAPPRKPWVGLTDEEIQFMAHNDDKGDWSDLRFRSCWHNGYVDGVNAANDKLKEKNT